MRRNRLLFRTMPILVATSMVLLLFTTFAFSTKLYPDVNAEDRPAEEAPAAAIDPTKIEGHAKCIDCHKVEIKAWLASKHATRAFDLLRTSPTSREYASKLGIRPVDIARKSLCVNCHATPQIDRDGNLNVLAGVSCESCHNASGGDDGWLNPHAVYGSPGTRREQEPERHYEQRAKKCEQAGQFRSADLYQLAKRCFACHLVDNEDLAEAGHDHGDRFELLEKMMGEVRHNFFIDPARNAEVATLWTDSLHHEAGRTAAGRKRVVFVVGQLVGLETSLRNLATASDENDFSDLMFDRIEEAFEILAEDVVEEVEQVELPELEAVVKTVEPVYEKLDDDGFVPGDRLLYLEAADAVAKAAMEFARRDGRQLPELDEIFLILEDSFEGFYEP